jgi:hypothetical protein
MLILFLLRFNKRVNCKDQRSPDPAAGLNKQSKKIRTYFEEQKLFCSVGNAARLQETSAAGGIKRTPVVMRFHIASSAQAFRACAFACSRTMSRPGT